MFFAVVLGKMSLEEIAAATTIIAIINKIRKMKEKTKISLSMGRNFVGTNRSVRRKILLFLSTSLTTH